MVPRQEVAEVSDGRVVVNQVLEDRQGPPVIDLRLGRLAAAVVHHAQIHVESHGQSGTRWRPSYGRPVFGRSPGRVGTRPPPAPVPPYRPSRRPGARGCRPIGEDLGVGGVVVDQLLDSTPAWRNSASDLACLPIAHNTLPRLLWLNASRLRESATIGFAWASL